MKKLPIVLASLALLGCFAMLPPRQARASTPTLPLVSLNVPAFASSQKYGSVGPQFANDGTYDTYWRSSGPAWLAYDLSSKALTGNVLVVWYNTLTGTYDHALANQVGYNIPGTYTLETNAAPGGGSPPADGWTVQATISGNTYHSRQSIINMAGANWLRINVSVVDGTTSNIDVAINMDVYDASALAAPLPDDFIFFGDSITREAMTQLTANGVPSFAQLIANGNPGRWPAEENGGIGGAKTADGAAFLPTWLSLFPGTYVGLAYGTNDALGCISQTTVFNNFDQMVQDTLAAGKVPIIPHIPWGPNSTIQRCGPTINAAIDQITTKYGSQVIVGPDLWSIFLNQTQLFNSDGIHPNDAGSGVYRQAFATTICQAVYGVTC